MSAVEPTDRIVTGAETYDEAGPAPPLPTRVRYRVLGAACVLAIITYMHRVGFATASNELHLDAQQVGDLMAAFMVAYGLFEMPWGRLADRFGVRHPLAIVALGGSITTAAVALVAPLPRGSRAVVGALLVLRFLFGAFQAGTFPTISRMMADWMPTTERGLAQGLIWTSSRLGGAIVPLGLAALFTAFGDWPVPLVLTASLGLVWCGLFWPWFRNRPDQLPQVNRAERKVIDAGRVARPKADHGPVPWGLMLGSRNAWALCLMYGFLGYSGNFFLMLLPAYLKNARHLDRVQFSLLTSIPFACGIAACLLGGVLSDQIIRRTGSRRWGRRLVGACGMLLAGLAIVGANQAGPTWLLAVLLGLTFFGNDLAMGPAWAAAADIGERHTGILSGAMNMMASLAAALSALVTGRLFAQQLTTLPFLIFAASYALGAICWLTIDVTRPLADEPALAGIGDLEP